MTIVNRLRDGLAANPASVMALASGLVFALATPPFDLYPCVLVGLFGLAWSLGRATRVRDGFGLGLLWATAAGLLGMRFVPTVVDRFTPLGRLPSLLALVLLALAQAAAWGLGGAVAIVARRRAGAPSPLMMALATWIAVASPTVIAWTPAGLISPWPALLQLGEVIGERGLSVLFAAWAGMLAHAVELTASRTWRAARRPLVATALGLAAVSAHGAVALDRLNRESPATVRLALVQGATSPEARWQPMSWPQQLATLRHETAHAENAGVELTIWPEAAYPYPLRRDTRVMPRGQREILGGTIDGPVLFGFLASAIPTRGVDGSPIQDTYNSATIVNPDRSLHPTSDKVELLTFGEAVPFGEDLPALRRVFQRSGGLRPGEAPRALTLARSEGPPLRIGVLNCYEDTLPAYGRRVVREVTPNVFVNLTNDAWFSGTAAPELHLRLAALRAIEHRRDLVRSVNLGPTAWIDAGGRLRAIDRSTEPSSLVVTPALREGETTYTKLGDWPTLLLLGCATLASFARRRRVEA